MKVLIVCRKIDRNQKLHKFPIAEFVLEQNEALMNYKVEFDYYFIEKSGFLNYIKYIFKFYK